jgi:hypothetical protein
MLVMRQVEKIPEFEIVKNFIHILVSNDDNQTALEQIVRTP